MSTATVAAVPQVTLFERLGGVPAIKAAVDAFYARVLADEALAPHFVGVNMRWLKGRQNAFFIQALGGPQVYRGRDMKTAHAHLAITADTVRAAMLSASVEATHDSAMPTHTPMPRVSWPCSGVPSPGPVRKPVFRGY